MRPQPEIRAFFDEATKTVTYLLWDAATREAAVIDPVLDFDFASGEVDTRWHLSPPALGWRRLSSADGP